MASSVPASASGVPSPAGGLDGVATDRALDGVATDRALDGVATNRALDGCPAVASAAWLHANADADGLIIVDIRTEAEYAAGHIGSSINIPFEVPLSAWITMRDDLLLELPEASDLALVLGRAGISKDSHVVVVSSVGQPPFPQAGATRVAVTLAYAGVRRVTILDGGHPAWVRAGLPVTTEVPDVAPVEFEMVADPEMFVDIDGVRDRIAGSPSVDAKIVDARDVDVYAGAVVEPWADKPGHIPSAISLPAASIWNADGTFRSRHELEAMAAGALGDDASARDVVVYCGVGGYASSWLFVLTRLLGYRDVTMYDGSAQEWVRSEAMAL